VSGAVYVLEAGPYVKIGRTRCSLADAAVAVERRRRAIQGSCPLPLATLYHVFVSDPAAIEWSMHQYFAEYRIRQTEFFELPSEARYHLAQRLGYLDESGRRA
jgi:hypothetical protein